jgi:hypothetical protein
VKPALLPLPTAGDRWTSSTVLSPVARDYLRGVAAAFFITAPISSSKCPRHPRVRGVASLRCRAPPVWLARPSKTSPRASAALGSALPPRGCYHLAVFAIEGTRSIRLR